MALGQHREDRADVQPMSGLGLPAYGVSHIARAEAGARLGRRGWGWPVAPPPGTHMDEAPLARLRGQGVAGRRLSKLVASEERGSLSVIAQFPWDDQASSDT